MKPIQITIRPGAALALLALPVLLAAAWPATQQQSAQGLFRQVTALTQEQAEILDHMSIVYLDDGQGGQAMTIRIEGVNVQIVNGLGATNGNPALPFETDPTLTTTNGLGNLILGYNELGNPTGDDRTGSHNLLSGIQVNASSFGGTVAGHRNRTTAPFACASGGTDNTSSGLYSSISGGKSGLASGWAASISGGNAGTASGTVASIVGGQLNRATGLRATVLGGGSNDAMAEESVVVGGGHAFDVSQGNITRGIRSCIVGGSANETMAGAHTSVISGGIGVTTTGSYDWAAGGLYEN